MLLDTASLYFRAFYGLPDTIRAPDGTPVNAVRGLLDFIGRLVTDFEPTHLVACWDDDWRPQWRVDLIPSYKEHRVEKVVAGGPDVEETPELLVAQIPLIRETLEAFGIAIVGAAEHEADDVIGTLATRATMPVDVVTGDRDLFQLIDDDREVRIVYTARGMNKLEVLTGETVRVEVRRDGGAVRRLRGPARRRIRWPARRRRRRREDRGDPAAGARRPRRHHRRGGGCR